MERKIQTADGRTLAVQESGDAAGKPVLVHFGTPNSRHMYAPIAADAAARGLRLISYDRPGYGGSDPRPGRVIADCAADVLAICDALGIGRLATWGISGGGPHVLACAALLPGLVAAAASLASPAPYPAEGIDWFDGMGQANADDFRLILADEAAGRAHLEEEREQMLTVTGGDLLDAFSSLLSPADTAVLTGDLADYLAFCCKEGIVPGSQGWWDDSHALSVPWGFDPAAITVPVMVMHGREDKFVPFAHGQWLAARIPGARTRLLADDGHLTLMTRRIPEVHAWLAEHL